MNHVSRWARRIAVLGLLAALAPACGDSIPYPLAEKPTFNPNIPASGIPHFPLIVIKWNEPMDGATMQGNILMYRNDTGAAIGTDPTVVHLDGSNETLVSLTGNLPSGVTPAGIYVVGGNSNIKSLSGHSLAAGLVTVLTWFEVTDDGDTGLAATVSTFGGIAAAAGSAADKVDLTFDLGNIGGVRQADISYDVYHSTTLKGEDLIGSPITTVNGTTAAAGQPVGKGLITVSSLAAATTHYFIVVARITTGTGIGNVLIGNLPNPEVSFSIP